MSAGRRLDKTQPGSRLGLPIAGELLRLAGGTLALEQSPPGGSRVRPALPLAP
ncbi:hypothetical protein [Aquincola tertiaricarbonis]|uniref:hypothetical protein n=1 Tax=Aquincola tertiaricarbonis TaxID=391953 RepID=UPI0012EE6D7D|nr:hypothetical protein [Aquincola tertiaricarbonis]